MFKNNLEVVLLPFSFFLFFLFLLFIENQMNNHRLTNLTSLFIETSHAAHTRHSSCLCPRQDHCKYLIILFQMIILSLLKMVVLIFKQLQKFVKISKVGDKFQWVIQEECRKWQSLLTHSISGLTGRYTQERETGVGPL